PNQRLVFIVITLFLSLKSLSNRYYLHLPSYLLWNKNVCLKNLFINNFCFKNYLLSSSFNLNYHFLKTSRDKSFTLLSSSKTTYFSFANTKEFTYSIHYLCMYQYINILILYYNILFDYYF